VPCRFKSEFTKIPCDTPETDILKSGLCIFHDEKYLKNPKDKESNKQNIKRKLTEKIEKCISDNKVLMCIEYHLPDFTFENFKNFTIPANFSGTIFVGPVNFSEAQFTKEAIFSEAQFTKEAIFSEAQFTKEANFYWTQFTEKADFSEAQFTKEAIFLGAQFTKEADFHWTQFTKEAIFYRAQFTKEAYFTDDQFTEKADFSEAQFTKEAIFFRAQFSEKADFHEAEFTEKADFSGAQFRAESNFNKARFMNRTEFSHSKFIQEAIFVDTIFNFRSSFNYVLFRDPENILFQTDELSQISFMNTDISRVRFGENVKWGLADRPTRRYLKKWGHGDKNEFKILEEREIESSLARNGKVQNILMGSVLAVYRNLRENYEYRMRYDEAGEFFIREMEMKRKYKEVSLKKKEESSKEETVVENENNVKKKEESLKNGTIVETKNDEQTIVEIRLNNRIIQNFSLTGLYYHLSRYGQSFSRPALFGVGIVLFSTLLWLTQPNPAGDFSLYNFTISEMGNTENIQIAFERSLTNFLPNLSFGTEMGAGLIDFAFKIVGGAVTFGLIIIALRRKFERKFRH
jgi:uncharacterized protein YjbI with pentapeptide repeats